MNPSWTSLDPPSPPSSARPSNRHAQWSLSTTHSHTNPNRSLWNRAAPPTGTMVISALDKQEFYGFCVGIGRGGDVLCELSSAERQYWGGSGAVSKILLILVFIVNPAPILNERKIIQSRLNVMCCTYLWASKPLLTNKPTTTRSLTDAADTSIQSPVEYTYPASRLSLFLPRSCY